ncbi:uncharacterized protein BX664DRAFT_334432 [Halteromyces radiatus]|uniref:uncharacterized protein n=1 Tax=Halteromyces radiatus TaxID=101107 RepID=UPI002220B5BF|nr:uncharacterized protein BX664DRAFT_334432 [Halteromyces radiatus]KAI8090001.1 hypothetical protein BX664DRAFT_334432 [Halteromyces radiatus]
MPGFILEEGFPLARFQNTIGSTHMKNKFIVDLNPLCSTLSTNNTIEQSDTETATDADQVVVTIQGEGIKLYDTTAQKCLKSWTTPPGISFAHPAIYYPATGDETLNYTYALVDSGSDITQKEERKTIWMWKDAQNNEEIASSANRVSKTFEQRIQAIHVSPSLRFNTIFVYENGSIDLVTKDLDRFTANYKNESNENVMWSTVFVTTSSHIRPCCIPNSMVPANSTIVVTICQAEGSDNYSVKLHYINEERRSINVAAEIDLNLKNKPVSFTLDSTLGILTILESDGMWTVYHLSLKHRSSNKIAAYLEQGFQTQFKHYQVYNKTVGNVASMAALADNFVVFVAPRINEKGSNSIEHVVSVWDVKYGTLQAEQVIKTSEKQITSGDWICKVDVLRNSHIAVTISSIQFKTTGNGKSSKRVADTKSVVTLCPYYNQPMSLMAAMNKMKSTATFLGIDMHSLTDKTNLNIGLTRSGQSAVLRGIKPGKYDNEVILEKWNTLIEENQSSETALLKSLMDDKLTKEEFCNIFMNHVQMKQRSLDNDLVSSSKYTKENLEADQKLCWRTYFSNKRNEERRTLSSELLSVVVGRIFATKNGKPDLTFWSPCILVYLMAMKQLRSGFINGGLMRGLVDHKAWYLVPLALETVIDIPETDLVLLIKELVALCIQEQTAWWHDSFPHYLKMVMQAPRNEIYLQHALKRLTLKELPIVLNAIVQWLNGKGLKSKGLKLHHSSNDSLRKRNNIVEFTSTLLDIHYPTIILEPSLHDMVTDLVKASLALTEQVEDLEELSGILAPFERTRKIKTKEATLRAEEKKYQKGAPRVDKKLAPTKLNTKYGGEEGVPVYRVEVFQF